MLLNQNTNSITTGYNTPQMTEITSGDLTLPDQSLTRWLNAYSIDCDRILFYGNFRLAKSTSSVYTQDWQHRIKVLSLSKGVIFECGYPENAFGDLLLIPGHNLAILYTFSTSPLTVISLLNGEIQHQINITVLRTPLCSFQHFIDTKIINYNYKFNQFYTIDVVTGDVNVHSFPISEAKYCRAISGHMVMINEETTFVTSFVPELL
ncbi:hypothetical protein BDF19DRAFT_448545 [Syncephalis fuscata]|nr:hypothetical protein BDF19DRAFT_448545 [Syncephalis fuscata]